MLLNEKNTREFETRVLSGKQNHPYLIDLWFCYSYSESLV